MKDLEEEEHFVKNKKAAGSESILGKLHKLMGYTSRRIQRIPGGGNFSCRWEVPRSAKAKETMSYHQEANEE